LVSRDDPLTATAVEAERGCDGTAAREDGEVDVVIG
jgi:hypothetical protein